MKFFEYAILAILLFVHATECSCDEEEIKTFLEGKNLKDVTDDEIDSNPYGIEFEDYDQFKLLRCIKDNNIPENQLYQDKIVILCVENEWHFRTLGDKNGKVKIKLLSLTNVEKIM